MNYKNIYIYIENNLTQQEITEGQSKEKIQNKLKQ